jgi:hypothetical protein
MHVFIYSAAKLSLYMFLNINAIYIYYIYITDTSGMLCFQGFLENDASDTPTS